MNDIHVKQSCHFPLLLQQHKTAQSASRKAGLTLAAGNCRDLGALTALLNALVLLTHLLDTSTTRVLNVCNVPKVRVNPNELSNSVRLNVGDDDVPWTAVVGAVAATAVQLASVDDGKIFDCDCAAAVMLHDLVDCFLSSAAFRDMLVLSPSIRAYFDLPWMRTSPFPSAEMASNIFS